MWSANGTCTTSDRKPPHVRPPSPRRRTVRRTDPVRRRRCRCRSRSGRGGSGHGARTTPGRGCPLLLQARVTDSTPETPASVEGAVTAELALAPAVDEREEYVQRIATRPLSQRLQESRTTAPALSRIVRVGVSSGPVEILLFKRSGAFSPRRVSAARQIRPKASHRTPERDARFHWGARSIAGVRDGPNRNGLASCRVGSREAVPS